MWFSNYLENQLFPMRGREMVFLVYLTFLVCLVGPTGKPTGGTS